MSFNFICLDSSPEVLDLVLVLVLGILVLLFVMAKDPSLCHIPCYDPNLCLSHVTCQCHGTGQCLADHSHSLFQAFILVINLVAGPCPIPNPIPSRVSINLPILILIHISHILLILHMVIFYIFLRFLTW